MRTFTDVCQDAAWLRPKLTKLAVRQPASEMSHLNIKMIKKDKLEKKKTT